MNIKNIVKNAGVALERTAYNKFGAAVESGVNGLLNKSSLSADDPRSLALQSKRLSDGSPVDAGSAAQRLSTGKVWEPTKYAAAITAEGQEAFDPKQKFLFKVTFHFHPDILSSIGPLSSTAKSAELAKSLTFMVKNIDLPTAEYEYETVNMYNFKTHILKSTSYKDLNFSFMDDVGNSVIDMVNVYRMLHKPAARQTSTSWPLANHPDFSLEFTNGSSTKTSSSSRDVLPGGAKSIFTKVVIHQFYVSRGSGSAGSVEQIVKTNDFIFINPQITDFDMGGLDHENSGEPNLIIANFRFDSLIVKPNQSTFSNGKYKHTDISLDTRDMMTGVPPPGISGALKDTSVITAGGGFGDFANVASSVIGRGIQSSISGALNRRLGGLAGGALSGAINSISSGIGSAVKGTAAGVTSAVTTSASAYVRDASKSLKASMKASARTKSAPGG